MEKDGLGDGSDPGSSDRFAECVFSGSRQPGCCVSAFRNKKVQLIVMHKYAEGSKQYETPWFRGIVDSYLRLRYTYLEGSYGWGGRIPLRKSGFRPFWVFLFKSR